MNDNRKTPLFRAAHYDWLANNIRRAVTIYGEDPEVYGAFCGLIVMLAEALQADNPNFDSKKFKLAAMPQLD